MHIDPHLVRGGLGTRGQMRYAIQRDLDRWPELTLRGSALQFLARDADVGPAPVVVEMITAGSPVEVVETLVPVQVVVAVA